MTRLPFACVFAALVLPPADAPAAPGPEAGAEVKAILAKANEARLGTSRDKYSEVSRYFAATFHYPGQETRVTGISHTQSPDKIRLEVSGVASGQEFSMTRVFDGTKGWESVNGTVTEMTKEDVAEYRDWMYESGVAGLNGLSAPGVTLTALGRSKVGGKSAVGLRVSAKGRPEVSLYFDEGTGLLLKMATRCKERGTGAEYIKETLYDDYKNISGVMTAFRIAGVRDGKTYFTAEYLDVSMAEKLPDDTFSKP